VACNITYFGHAFTFSGKEKNLLGFRGIFPPIANDPEKDAVYLSVNYIDPEFSTPISITTFYTVNQTDGSVTKLSNNSLFITA
jgi:hypothetical protein